MQKLLTAEAARNVFKNGSSRDFLKHGELRISAQPGLNKSALSILPLPV